jgi:hypothetical protein
VHIDTDVDRHCRVSFPSPEHPTRSVPLPG